MAGDSAPAPEPAGDRELAVRDPRRAVRRDSRSDIWLDRAARLAASGSWGGVVDGGGIPLVCIVFVDFGSCLVLLCLLGGKLLETSELGAGWAGEGNMVGADVMTFEVFAF